ncbi:MAG: DUF3565 domain-containing protein [Gemmatimonadota bacterium]|nr:DUF3565 domain-containing protein [Gemmatimonadota bacterium]
MNSDSIYLLQSLPSNISSCHFSLDSIRRSLSLIGRLSANKTGETLCEKAIIRYWGDESSRRSATLTCGHGQLVRHGLPFVNRPWTAEGPKAMLGQGPHRLKCEIPDDEI